MSDVTTFLQRRRSVFIPALREPAPDDGQLRVMLRIASRVPDHGKLAPWRFIIYRGEASKEIGRALRAILEAREGTLSDIRRSAEENRFSRSPVVVGVVSTAKPHVKIPEWEQVLSAGAAAMNLVNAAHSLGFGANWVSEWVAYDDEAKAVLEIDSTEKVAGFIHIGTATEVPADRTRPDLGDIVREATGPGGA